MSNKASGEQQLFLCCYSGSEGYSWTLAWLLLLAPLWGFDPRKPLDTFPSLRWGIQHCSVLHCRLFLGMIQLRQIKIRNKLENLCWSWQQDAVAYQSLVARVGFLIQDHIPEQVEGSSAGLDGPVCSHQHPTGQKAGITTDKHRYLHVKIPKSHPNFISKFRKHHP